MRGREGEQRIWGEDKALGGLAGSLVPRITTG